MFSIITVFWYCEEIRFCVDRKSSFSRLDSWTTVYFAVLFKTQYQFSSLVWRVHCDPHFGLYFASRAMVPLFRSMFQTCSKQVPSMFQACSKNVPNMFQTCSKMFPFFFAILKLCTTQRFIILSEIQSKSYINFYCRRQRKWR